MKPILLLAGIFAALTLQAQKPEKIYGNARQSKPLNYYKEQAIAWKKEIEKNPKDPTNWYNYYYVNRNLFYNDTTDSRSAEDKHKDILKLVDEMAKHVPESYEYNLVKWMSGGFNMQLLPYLKKAAELGQDRNEHLDFMINMGEVSRNLKDRDLYSQKKFEAGLFSSGILYYNYNVLAGLEKNAILLTDGDNDTYPIWYLQSQGIRKDVTVLNFSLINGLNDYRDKLFAELGVEKWERTVDFLDKQNEAEHERYRNGLIKHLAANKKNAPVYIALTATCRQKFLQPVMEKLYLTGLAYLYSEKSIDNMALLRRNAEQNFALDYIDKAFYKDLSPDMVKLINGNYIVPLLKLYDHYHLSGDKQRKDWIKAKLISISRGTDNEKEVQTYLAANS